MIRAVDLADYVLAISSKELSNLELQQILYQIELAYIRKFNKHLIADEFEAWNYGPVLREVYYKYRNYGANSIEKPNLVLNKDRK